LADPATWTATRADAADVDAALAGRSVVTIEGWRGIDAAERALGAQRGRERTTLHDRRDLLHAADL
jgi:ferredoxin--NADP+ reductase